MNVGGDNLSTKAPGNSNTKSNSKSSTNGNTSVIGEFNVKGSLSILTLWGVHIKIKEVAGDVTHSSATFILLLGDRFWVVAFNYKNEECDFLNLKCFKCEPYFLF